MGSGFRRCVVGGVWTQSERRFTRAQNYYEGIVTPELASYLNMDARQTLVATRSTLRIRRNAGVDFSGLPIYHMHAPPPVLRR